MQIYTNIEIVKHEEIQNIEKTGLPLGRFLTYDPNQNVFIALDNIFGQVDKFQSNEHLNCILFLEGIDEKMVARYSKNEGYEPNDLPDAHLYNGYKQWKERIESSSFGFLAQSSNENFELVTVKDANDGKRQLFTNEGKSVEELSTETAFGHFEDARFFAQEVHSASDNDFERVPTLVLKPFVTDDDSLRIRYNDKIVFGRVFITSECKNLGNAIYTFLKMLDKTRVSTNTRKDVHDIHAITLKMDES
ncbi:hypothetical protein [Exiguobacterium sp. BG5(2022)]|uniref:hypothetical protein n=1 Tax=Exiguobacterium sp. BG5(2022) TaxID=2962595 RepID=UPI002881F4E8|nr:hypothetical protein [Exiguobacterium sp. BG5(2022)]MDT0193697.1 hypothetical protein [Exiguobacterium sp. BG5(2022)]